MKFMQIEQLGPYRIARKLGQGGMGAVYAAVDTESGQAAAVKILSPTLATEEGFRVRFDAEIESLKKLRHPNIVRLYGYGEQQGMLFYAMELVEGTSLEEELRRGRRFDWREVTQIGIKICRALKHAHDHGVIHRDLKPANLLISAEGEVKLSDFGIARLFGNVGLTNAGGVLGTAEYMAPEQADGRAVSERCDQYSLGGVMFALLAGRPPFRAATLVEMLQLQRFAEPPPVRRYAPETPLELERIIGQMLHKEPQARFVNTMLIARSLEAMERGLSVAEQRGEAAAVEPAEPAEPRTLEPSDETLGPEDVGGDEGGLTFRQSAANVAAETAAGPMAADEPPNPLAADAPARFTKVDETAREPADPSGVLRVWASPQTLVLAAALLSIGLVAWWSLRPPTADSLYQKIQSNLGDGGEERLSSLEPAIAEFLSSFSGDPRSAELRGYQDAIELAQLERRLQVQARRGRKRDAVGSPIERLYLEASASAVLNPQGALAKFQAIERVFGPADGGQAAEPVRQVLELARRQIARLKPQVDEQNADDVRYLDSTLKRAEQLASSDPAAARELYAAAIVLYADKPWASALVEKARAAQAELSARPNETAAEPSPPQTDAAAVR